MGIVFAINNDIYSGTYNSIDSNTGNGMVSNASNSVGFGGSNNVGFVKDIGDDLKEELVCLDI